MTPKQPIQMMALRGKVVEVFGSINKFAEAFGITPVQMQNKIAGRSGWSLEDARKAVSLLGIENDANEIKRIFF